MHRVQVELAIGPIDEVLALVARERATAPLVANRPGWAARLRALLAAVGAGREHPARADADAGHGARTEAARGWRPRPVGE